MLVMQSKILVLLGLLFVGLSAIPSAAAIHTRSIAQMHQPTLLYASPALPDTIIVGSQTLALCDNAGGYCGTFDRPLDPTGEVTDRIQIAYRWFPHTDQRKPSSGVIVANEGGPGFGSVGSASSYLALFAAAHVTRELLTMDNRGTGGSGALDCPAIQSVHVLKPREINLCAAQLARTGHLYGTRLAVKDMAAILDALGVGKVDMYGDSYGTYFTQVFSALYPQRLRSLMMDGASPVRGATAFYTNTLDAGRRTFTDVCRLSPNGCQGTPANFVKRLEILLNKLRKTPFIGTATDNNGALLTVTISAPDLFYVINHGGGQNTVYRDFDAAIRAYLNKNDKIPLLRLRSEAVLLGDATDISFDPSYASKALFVAVTCSDFPNAYDLRAPFALRQLQLKAAIADELRKHPNLYAPYTVDEFIASHSQTSPLDACLEWRWPSANYTPGQPIPRDAILPAVPTLVLSADLDVLTPIADSAEVAKQYPNATFVRVANSFHVTALGDLDNCSSVIVARFIETLSAGDTRCSRHIPPVRLVPEFSTWAVEVAPAPATAGDTATSDERKRAAIAVASAGDAIARSQINFSGISRALRGGAEIFTALSNTVIQVQLKNALWVEDVAVNGSVIWDQTSGQILAQLTTTDSRGPHAGRQGHFLISWSAHQTHPLAVVSGAIGKHMVHAAMIAP